MRAWDERTRDADQSPCDDDVQYADCDDVDDGDDDDGG